MICVVFNLSTESDFDKIFSRTVKPSYSELERLWEWHGSEWLCHLSGLPNISVCVDFEELSAEEQFAFWAWTRENKEKMGGE